MDSYLNHVGFVQFPRRPADLTAAVCPACFTPRGAASCPKCGLDFTNAAIAELDEAGTDASAALDRRLELIGRIRFDSAAAASAVSAPVAPAPAAPAPVAVLPSAPAEPRRHLGVQVVLLIIGVSLLAVGAIFFLVYAFITFGLVWRSVIIGAVTVASFAGATLLRRRRLGATAEAIAALAVVLVYLDAFAVRANDLFGLGGSDALVYWGIALVLSSVGLAVWHRLSGLRLPHIVAFLSFPPALALLAAGVTGGLDDSLRAFIALGVLAAAALVHPLARGRAVERTVSLSLALLGLVGAALTAIVMVPSSDWAPLAGLLVVAALAGAHVAVLLRRRERTPLAAVLAAVGAVAAAAAFVPVATRIASEGFTVAVPLLTAAVVAVGLELVARRTPTLVSRVAAVSAAVVAGIALAVVTMVGLLRLLSVASLGRDRWSIRGGTSLEVQPVQAWAVLALAVLVGLVALAWAAGGVLRARRAVVAAAVPAVLVLGVPLTGQLWLAVLAWLVLAAALVGLLVVAHRRRWGTGIRLAFVVVGALSLALSYSASWASIDTWWFASVGTVILLVVGRAATGSVPARAALLGVAAVIALVAIGSEAWHTNERFQGGADAGIDTVHAVLFLAILLMGLAAALSRVLSRLETRVLFWLPAATAAGAVILSTVLGSLAVGPRLVLPEPATSIVLGVLLLGGLVVWVLQQRFTVERIAASAALTPGAAWLAGSLVRDAELASWVAPAAAGLVVAAVSLALAARGSRSARDVGVAAVVVPLVLAAVATGTEATWLVLLLAAVTTFALSVSPDGLFGSASPRRFLGWLALGLGFLALSRHLADRGITDLEPYVLPLTGALLLVAALAWRRDRSGPAPAYIALGALLVSLVPLGVVSGTGSPARGLAVAGASAALLLVGSAVRGSKWADVAAAAGAVGVLITGLARPFALALAGTTSDVTLDAWLVGTVVVLLLAAVGQARTPGALRGTVNQAVLLAALVAAVAIEASVVRDSPLGTGRALGVVGALSVLHVVGLLAQRPPFSRVLAWGALALAAVMTVAAGVAGALDPIESATAILAAALLVTGAARLRRDSRASSWPWLAPGVLVLLLPSLLATFTDQPVWRLVGLGLACVAAIVAGALLKLQAPLLVGGVVVLVHALRTFSPQLAAVYQSTEWWVWAVVGGAVIVFVAVTFERRMRDLKAVGGRIAALR